MRGVRSPSRADSYAPPMSRRRLAGIALAAGLAVSACASASDGGDPVPDVESSTEAPARYTYPPPPAAPSGEEPDAAADGAVDRIVDGKIEKFYSQSVLLDQAFIKDDSKTVRDLVNELVAKIGENIKIARFVRFQIGQ